MAKTLSVSAIATGTVIDHIPARQALPMLQLLNISTAKDQMTIGINLPSKVMLFKDIIKIENGFLSEQKRSEIAIFASNATINIIDNFKIQQKIKATMPALITAILVCPNTNCITRHEPISSTFKVKKLSNRVELQCQYCEKIFNRDEIKDYVK